MAQYVITHGSMKVGARWLAMGETVELPDDEAAKHVGCLRPKAQYELEQAAEKAKDAVLKGKRP